MPTVAVLLAWVALGAVLVGCGYLVRSALLHMLDRERHEWVRLADFWVGLTVLVTYLAVWNLGRPVNSVAWLVPMVVGGAGWLVAMRKHTHRIRSTSWLTVALGGVAAVWLANRSLLGPWEYDSGMYHLSAIDYASAFQTLPGLANLHSRLGAGVPHFLFTAFAGSGPWSGGGHHLANGLLTLMLIADLGNRAIEGFESRTARTYTWRFATLLLPAVLSVVAVDTGRRISSPNIDIATFVFVVVGSVYLAEAVENWNESAALISVCAFSLAVVNRPFYAPALIAASIAIVLAAHRVRVEVKGLMRTAAVLAIVPASLLISWMARQAVLSGYPLFPLSIGGLPVDWRLPEPVLADANRWVRSWARAPGEPPKAVLANWGWLSGWARARLTDSNLLGPAIAAVCVGATILRRRVRRGQSSGIHIASPIAVLIPVALTLVVWFVGAPDPRFVYAPLWIGPIALLAWVLPDVSERRGVQATAVAMGALALLTVGFIGVGHAYHPIRANGSGPFGAAELGPPRVQEVVTVSGLRIWRPISGDQCWTLRLCTPEPLRGLTLRGATLRSGFRYRYLSHN